jgi:hypothetical protein
VNLRRLGFLSASDWRKRFWQLVTGTTVLTVAFDFLEVPIQAMVFLLIVAIVATESRIWRSGDRTPLHFFGVCLGLLFAGAVFSLLDVTRTWCDPTHPYLQGHAIWHVLSALALLAAYLHYRQLEAELGGPQQPA